MPRIQMSSYSSLKRRECMQSLADKDACPATLPIINQNRTNRCVRFMLWVAFLHEELLFVDSNLRTKLRKNTRRNRSWALSKKIEINGNPLSGLRHCHPPQLQHHLVNNLPRRSHLEDEHVPTSDFARALARTHTMWAHPK